MDRETQDALLNLNRRFYQRVAPHFDATRKGWPPGLQAILPYFRKGAKGRPGVLDVGCGNGRFARLLHREGIRARYTGVDGNKQLLRLAKESLSNCDGVECRFLQADLADPGWADGLTARQAPGSDRAGLGGTEESCPPFDVLLCTATLQHLPGYELRLRLLKEFRRLCSRHTILSFWQFLGRARFRSRLIEPESVGLQPDRLEPGDALLPWRQGVSAVRYVHQVDDQELASLAADAGFAVLEKFRADGKRIEAGSSEALPGMNLYAVLWPEGRRPARSDM